MPCSPERRPVLAASPSASPDNTGLASSPEAPRLARGSSARLLGHPAGSAACGGRRLGGVVAACIVVALVVGVGYFAIPPVGASAGPALRGERQGMPQAPLPAPPRHVVPVEDAMTTATIQPLPPTTTPSFLVDVLPEAAPSSITSSTKAAQRPEAPAEQEEVTSTSTTKTLSQLFPNNKTIAGIEQEEDKDTDVDEEAEDEKKDEEHKVCRGGSRAACFCLLNCGVFGGEPDRCPRGVGVEADQKRNVMLHRLIDAALTSPHDACDAMRCIVDCSRDLDCFDSKVESDCTSFIDRKSQKSCTLSCSSEGGSLLPVSSAIAAAEAEEADEEHLESVGVEPFHFKK